MTRVLRLPAPRLVLLDRDGVLNHDLPQSVRRAEEYRPIPGAAAAVAQLNRAGILTALTSNQSILGRGAVTAYDFACIMRCLYADLAAAGAWLDSVHIAPDAPDRATPRRKPGPGLLLEAMTTLGVGPEATVMIGDSGTDAGAAAAAGVPFLLVRTGKGAATEPGLLGGPMAPLAVVDDLTAAVALLLQERAGHG